MGKSASKSGVILMRGLFPPPFLATGRRIPCAIRWRHRPAPGGAHRIPRTGSSMGLPAMADAAGPGRLPPAHRLHGKMLRLALAGLPALAVAACSAPPGPGRSAPAAPAACLASQLDFSLDGGDGRFNGMSHSGAMLVLRNAGKAACTIPARALPRLADANRQPLDIRAQDTEDPPGQPAPVTLAPGASATSDMRWVSGDVFDHGHCESPTFVTLALDGQTVSAAFTGHLCGAGGQPSAFTLTPFQLRTPDAAGQ